MNPQLSKYKAPFFLFHYHLETIYPSVLRPIDFNVYERERIDTEDDDFLDLDWTLNGGKQLIILNHGLEGNSKRPYMRGMAKYLSREGFDILSWSYRGCSGEANKKKRFYHSGATEDLNLVVEHAINADRYEKIGLVGFSLGGNLILKYLGEDWKSKNRITAALSISVPVDLDGCSKEILKPHNWIYTNRFLVTLKKKVKEKSKEFPDLSNGKHWNDIKNLREFDNYYTAPVHGFKDAVDYYHQCSSLQFLKSIDIPTLIINAENDSFLSESCYPEEVAKSHDKITLKIPKRGGHVGFSSPSGIGQYWTEKLAVQFFVEKFS